MNKINIKLKIFYKMMSNINKTKILIYIIIIIKIIIKLNNYQKIILI
jgi:hypothetical protein